MQIKISRRAKDEQLTDGCRVISRHADGVCIQIASNDGFAHSISQEYHIGLLKRHPHSLLINPFLNVNHEPARTVVGGRVDRGLNRLIFAALLADFRVGHQARGDLVLGPDGATAGPTAVSPVAVPLGLWWSPRGRVGTVALECGDHGEGVAGEIAQVN